MTEAELWAMYEKGLISTSLYEKAAGLLSVKLRGVAAPASVAEDEYRGTTPAQPARAPRQAGQPPQVTEKGLWDQYEKGHVNTNMYQKGAALLSVKARGLASPREIPEDEAAGFAASPPTPSGRDVGRYLAEAERADDDRADAPTAEQIAEQKRKREAEPKKPGQRAAEYKGLPNRQLWATSQ